MGKMGKEEETQNFDLGEFYLCWKKWLAFIQTLWAIQPLGRQLKIIEDHCPMFVLLTENHQKWQWLFTTNAVQHPLWSPAGTCCVSRAACWPLFPRAQPKRTGRLVAAASRRRPVGGSEGPLPRQVEPWRSWSPYRSACQKHSQTDNGYFNLGWVKKRHISPMSCIVDIPQIPEMWLLVFVQVVKANMKKREVTLLQWDRARSCRAQLL